MRTLLLKIDPFCRPSKAAHGCDTLVHNLGDRENDQKCTNPMKSGFVDGRNKNNVFFGFLLNSFINS